MFRPIPMTRTCVYVRIRACTRNDRYDMIIRTADALTHRVQPKDGLARKSIRNRRLVVSSADPFGPLLAILVIENDFPESRIFRHGREREEGFSWCAKARLTEIVYISLDLYHRAISPPPPPPSVSVSPSLSPRSLFCLSSLSASSLSELSLSLSLLTIDIAFARQRNRLSVFTHSSRDLSGTRAYRTRGGLDFDISAIYCGAT